jgi:hypothetical protein
LALQHPYPNWVGPIRLAQIEFRSRAREAAALHHFNKRPELIEIEAAHSL